MSCYKDLTSYPQRIARSLTPDVKRMIREHVFEKSDGGDYRMDGQAGVIWWKAEM